MEDTIKDTGLSFSLFKNQVNDDFFELLKPLPAENGYVTAPPYLMYYVGRMISFKQNKWLHLTSYNEIKQSTGKAELIIIVPAERSNVELALEKFKLVPNYIKALFIIPRITAIVQQVFDINGIQIVKTAPKKPNEIYVQEFHYDFFPVDDDYFLLPCYHSFSQINVENDYNDIYSSARALAKIQTVFGEVPHVVSIGKNAIYTKTLMQGLLKKTGSLSTQYPLIDSIFLFDRACDLVTPLASQMTFEGIIDELLGVNFGVCETKDKKYNEITLSEQYEIVSEIRGERALKVMDSLHNYIVECQKIKDGEFIKSWRDSNQGDFKTLMLRAKHLERQKSKLDELMFLAENYFKNRITDPFSRIILTMEYSSIANDEKLLPSTAETFIQLFNDWKTALRLIFLQLVINNKAVDTQLLIESFIDQFGEKAKQTIRTLDRLELLNQKSVQQYKISNSVLTLTNSKDKSGNDELLEMCDDIIPLMLRIIQFLTSNDMEKQNKLCELNIPIDFSGKLTAPVPGKPRKILVFFIGGITLSEVNLIRRFGKKLSNNKFQFIIGSTDQINMNTFMDQLCPNMFDNLK